MHFFISPQLVLIVMIELILCYLTYRKGWGAWPLSVVIVSVITLYVFAAGAYDTAFRNVELRQLEYRAEFDRLTMTGSLSDQNLAMTQMDSIRQIGMLEAENEISLILYKIAFFGLGILIPLILKEKKSKKKN